jgi:serine/threonine protein kinase
MMSHLSARTLLGANLGKYRLEELLGQSELGPLFAARADSDGPQARFLVRILSIPAVLTPETVAAFGGRWQREASHIATLQHPYILPLVDYGIANGMAYVVSPYVPVRSLSARIAQHGPVDALTVGRYLDQIAAALEYAHERTTIHRNLSTDCIYLQPDGRAVVADLGVRHLIELSAGDGRSIPQLGNLEACAPEQLLNRHVDAYTDVYALGAVVYRLLSGHPVFSGNRFDEIAQQHLSSPVPPLNLWQAGLPSGLDGLIATAMAKEPEKRFRHPGAMANAYHEIVAPNQMARVPFITTDGPGAAPSRQSSRQRATAIRSTGQLGDAGSADTGSMAGSGVSAATSSRMSGGPSLVPRRTGSLARTGRSLLFAALLLVVVSGTAYTLAALSGGFSGAARPTGTVTFSDNPAAPPGYTDAATIVVHNLSAPPAGYVYDAWLLNSSSEQTIALGTLSAKGSTFTLSYAGDGKSGSPGTNLLRVGDSIEITLEHGRVDIPIGKVQLSVTFPPKSFAHIKHLLVSFSTTPGHVGLLVGLLNQTQLLSAQAQSLQNAVSSNNTVAIRCIAQSLVDSIEGAQGTHYQPLPSKCAAQNITPAGDGYGLLGAKGYLKEGTQHASFAAIAPDAASAAYATVGAKRASVVSYYANYVQIATGNVTGWVTKLDQDALTLQSDLANSAVATEIATLADEAYRGVDANGDKQVDPVSGEAGAVSAYLYAQQMATFTLAPPA